MQRPTLASMNRRCQKPDHRRVGNWMARRISRPMALGVTWLIAPWGVSAHMATLAAWGCAAASAVAFGSGTHGGWLLGAALLQAWYLLDHVDGQLARFHGRASLDGTQLDYVMHHTVNLLLPLGVGFGLLLANSNPLWMLAGIAWAVGLLAGGLQHDARYKAFIQRLKRLEGQLHAVGGGGCRPGPTSPIPRRPWRLGAWAARKACEIHVTMNFLLLLAMAQWLWADGPMALAKTYVTLMALVAPCVAGTTLLRAVRRQAAEQEFASWFEPPPGKALVLEDGWWRVVDIEVGAFAQSRRPAGRSPTGSS